MYVDIVISNIFNLNKHLLFFFSIYQVFEKQLWKQSEDASQR